jgi:hypothetical protein
MKSQPNEQRKQKQSNGPRRNLLGGATSSGKKNKQKGKEMTNKSSNKS